MERSPSSVRHDYVLSMLLAGMAGWTDAVAYLYGRGIYVSFMSGNSTDFGVSISAHDWLKAIVVVGVLGCFVAGVVAGELLAKMAPARGRAWVLSVEALLLAAGATLAYLNAGRIFTLLALAFALGTQNASVHQVGDISVAVTYVTGTLVRLGRGVAAGLLGQGRWRMPGAYLGLWLALVCGALMGAAVSRQSVAGALAVVSLASLTLAMITRRTGPRAT